MVRAAVRLCVAVACVGACWLIGAGARARAQERAVPEPAISAIAASPGVLYVVRDGAPYQCREGRVPGPTILTSSAGWVCEPLQLHFPQ